jgi:hypothetical protein
MASSAWIAVCRDLVEEEYDWILMRWDFRSPDFEVLGRGAAESGYTRLLVALPNDQVLLALIRPPKLTDQPFLLIWSPVNAPYRHVTSLQSLKEAFWLRFLAGGTQCASKSFEVHDAREAAHCIDPSGALFEQAFPPPAPPEPEPDISNLLAALDGAASLTPTPPESPKPVVVAETSTPPPASSNATAPVPHHRLPLTAPPKKKRCTIL